MASSFSTTAGLLTFVQMQSGIPANTDEMTPAKWYMYLELAQKDIFFQIVAHAPQSQFGAPVKLTTPDEGYTYVFPSQPWGRAEIRESRNGSLLYPGDEFAASDFVPEGDTIRWPDNRSRTFADGPYARFAVEPGVIDESNEPTLKPANDRVVIAWRALEMWASKGGLRDPSPYAAEVQKILWGDPLQPGSVGLIANLKTQYHLQGGAEQQDGFVPYWKSPDLNPGAGLV